MTKQRKTETVASKPSHTPACTGKEFSPETCGVVWRGASLKRIQYCPLHESASDLLEAARFLWNEIDHGRLEINATTGDTEPYQAIDKLRAAISRAEAE